MNVQKPEAAPAVVGFDAWHDAKHPEPSQYAHKIGWRATKRRLREAWEAAIAALTPAAGGKPAFLWVEDDGGLRREPVAPEAAPAGVSLRERLQQQCSDWGTYWRGPDSHGVILSPEQALDLLRDALGVEVEITAAPVAAPAAGGAGAVDAMNAALAEAFCDDPANAVRAHAAMLPLFQSFAAPAPPPADAVRALVGKWRAESFARAVCADELEQALSAAPATINVGAIDSRLIDDAAPAGEGHACELSHACPTCARCYDCHKRPAYAAAPTPEGRGALPKCNPTAIGWTSILASVPQHAEDTLLALDSLHSYIVGAYEPLSRTECALIAEHLAHLSRQQEPQP